MFGDSHAHLTDSSVVDNLSELLDRATSAKVETIINVCTDKVTLARGVQLAEDVKWIYNIGATTPHDVEKEGGIYFHLFEQAACQGKLKAIGETGLDYHYQHSSKSLQQAFFIRYLQLAARCNLPVVVHCRNAFADLFAITDEHYKKGPLAVHCFTGTMRDAEKALERNWFISFSGIITFKKSQSLREVVRATPIQQIFIETDTPYLAPQTKRGKSNEPSFLVETARMVAEIKGICLEEVAKLTMRNMDHFFHLN